LELSKLESLKWGRICDKARTSFQWNCRGLS